MNSQDSAHPETCPLLQVCVLQDDGRVFTAEFQSDWRKVLCCCNGYLPSNLLRTNEGDVTNNGRPSNSFGIFRIAAHKLCMTINRRAHGNLERDRPGRVQDHIA